MNGTIGILNVGAGDTKLVFDNKSPDDMKRAARVVTDMLKRGFVILVEVGKDADGEALFRRIKKFDESRCEYIVAGDADVDYGRAEKPSAEAAAATRGKTGRKGRGASPKVTRIPATQARGIAVGRTAGG